MGPQHSPQPSDLEQSRCSLLILLRHEHWGQLGLGCMFRGSEAPGFCPQGILGGGLQPSDLQLGPCSLMTPLKQKC